MSKPIPSIDAWLKEAKAHESAPLCGMYLTHNGTVRQTAKAKVRYGAEDTKDVTGMLFSYDEEKVNAIIADIKGEEVLKLYDVPFVLVTAENVDQYLQ